MILCPKSWFIALVSNPHWNIGMSFSSKILLGGSEFVSDFVVFYFKES